MVSDNKSSEITTKYAKKLRLRLIWWWTWWLFCVFEILNWSLYTYYQAQNFKYISNSETKILVGIVLTFIFFIIVISKKPDKKRLLEKDLNGDNAELTKLYLLEKKAMEQKVKKQIEERTKKIEEELEKETNS